MQEGNTCIINRFSRGRLNQRRTQEQPEITSSNTQGKKQSTWFAELNSPWHNCKAQMCGDSKMQKFPSLRTLLKLIHVITKTDCGSKSSSVSTRGTSTSSSFKSISSQKTVVHARMKQVVKSSSNHRWKIKSEKSGKVSFITLLERKGK